MYILIIVKVIADLHIHSSYSRATSPHLSPPWLERWARIKGIGLLGAGDCTHPLWLEELRRQMDDAEEGFYILKKEIRDAFNAGPAMTEELPLPATSETPRFVLTGEIATIYKKGDKTRKIHHVIILPDFKAAAAFNARLEGMGGNIRSDGRPILGMDSRDLLALLLETDERALLIPAHIWTPWFSVLGEKSGFDSIEECYGDLAAHIPAIETGLSSNPPMNWALESLDRFSIISNSDAHSPDKLGREATILSMELSYPSLRRALFPNSLLQGSAAAPTILGTVEFFPSEGKYHYDGHRKCNVSLWPEEAARKNYLCPVCGKTLTRGVMGRVLELANRKVNEDAPCPPDYWGSNRRPYHSLIPLREIVAELLGTGTASKKTFVSYNRLIERGGSEFSILMDMDPVNLEKLSTPELSGEILAAAILKMRSGDVSVSPGYDGEYGKIRIFASGCGPQTKDEKGLFGELNKTSDNDFSGIFTTNYEPSVRNELRTFGSTRTTERRQSTGSSCSSGSWLKKTESAAKEEAIFIPDDEQEKAVSHDGRETIIIAGPGTGKTRVLTERIARIIKRGADPASILALTFTVKAAAELRERIERLCGHADQTVSASVLAATFHSFCCSVLREHCTQAGLPSDFKILGDQERDSLLRELGGRKTRKLGSYIEERKRFLLLPGEEFPLHRTSGDWYQRFLPPGQWEVPAKDAEMETLYGEYRQALKRSSCLDFEDLCAGTVRLLASHPEILKLYRARFRHIFVDEYQDINFPQYLLIRLLAPSEKFPSEKFPSEKFPSEKPDENAACDPGDTSNAEIPSLWVIGDPNQAIYGFRGSDKRFIDRFLSDYPDAGIFRLSKSFRCAQPIISAAGTLTGSRLRGRTGVIKDAVQDDGAENSARLNEAEVSLYRTQYPSEKSEAEGIARTIGALLGGTSFLALESMDSAGSAAAGNPSSGNGDLAPQECAVLVRASALAGPITKALKDHGIPFELSGTGPWWKEEPAAALLALLRERAKSLTSPASSPGDLIKAAWEELAVKDSHKKKKTEIVEKLIGLAAFFGDLSSLLDTLDSCAASGIPESQAMAGVRVMTIHASKGLEFEHVFVAGLEEGILPFTLFDKPGEGIEEERRLLYVAMTRAKRGLWLSWAQSRIYRGRKLTGNPSRFLSELEKIIPLARQDRKQKWDGQLSLF